MIINWKTLKEECPIAVQLIEKGTGFKYNAAYGTLLDDEKGTKQIAFSNLEGFFDNQGWFMSIYPVGFPLWNGIITDTQGGRVFNDQAQFYGVKSRNHAKTLIATIAIKYFNEALKSMIKVPDDKRVLTVKDHVSKEAQEKGLKYIQFSDLTLDGRGLHTISDFVLLTDGNESIVLKNKYESTNHPSGLLFSGIIINN